MSNIETRGYAHPEVLVSTDWVAAHLNDPSVRIIESNEDPLLYPSGHIPGAVQVDWTSDLNDPLRRDYLTREGFEKLMSRIGATQGHHRGVLRRQEQLVGVLRVLGVPALRPHERQGDGRRPPQVGEGEAALSRARCRASRRRPTRPSERDDGTHRAFRDEVLAHMQREAPAGRRAQSRGVHRRAHAHARLPARGRAARRPHPGREEHPLGARDQPGRRHVQDRRRAEEDLRRGEAADAVTSRRSPTAASASAAATPGSCSRTCSASRTSATTTAAGPSGAIW